MRLFAQKSALRLALLSIICSTGLLASGNEGVVNFVMRTGSWFDQYTDNPSLSTQEWLRSHFWRMQSTSSYFDSRISWFPNAWVYLDLYGIPTDSPLVGEHPDWFLKDGNGNWLYIPFACNGTVCTQYAADPGNADFRSYWISQASGILQRGYKGLWIDDVNLAFRVGTGEGLQVPPMDPRTGALMTGQDWMQYIADFTKAIRTNLPNTEIVHNSIWFAGGTERDYNPAVIEEIQQADWIDCERGVSDPSLTGGTGDWSLYALMQFVDHVHALGRNIIYLQYGLNGDYNLAGYYLTSNGLDGEGDQSMNPDYWYPGYSFDLGTAQNSRYVWNSLLRRDFSGGLVLLNPPQSPTITVTLPEPLETTYGHIVSQVTLAGGQASVLRRTIAQGGPAVQIDAGGTGVDSFVGDEYANGGSEETFAEAVDTNSPSNPAPEGVYQSKRTSFTPISYTIPSLATGHVYTVRLHFADDLSSAVGQRVFSVSINNTPVLTNFDIFSAAGQEKLKAVVRQFAQTPDANGQITIGFTPLQGAILISGIEVLP